MGILAAFLIMAFYTEVAGWVFAYVFKSFGSGLLSTDPDVTTSVFTSLVTDPVQSLIWQWVVLIVVSAIILLGVKKGIEGTTKKLLPILAILLVIIGIRSITLPNAGEGLSFLFKPDFSKITSATILTALGLAFFKLSIGMGAMLTYGSYYDDKQNIPANAARVVFSDLAISILAGIAIFPAVFSFGFEPAAGTQLLFITIPSVFASMPFGKFFMILFFLLTSFAAIGAMISLVEVVVAFLVNFVGWDRKKSTIITAVGMAVFGSLAALSNSSLAGAKIFGMSFFDFYDYSTSNILLPLGGLLMAIYVAWIWKWDKYNSTVSNEGTIQNAGFMRVIFVITKYVTPVLVAIILLTGLNIVKF
jgi:NSS family neurotransmitter:Na+ symporter